MVDIRAPVKAFSTVEEDAAAPDEMDSSNASSRAKGPAKGNVWLISVAFTAALLFGPIVIAAGFLTMRLQPVRDLSGISDDALRPSTEIGAVSGLRGDVD